MRYSQDGNRIYNEALSIDELEESEYSNEKRHRTALFGTILHADDEHAQQVDIIVEGLKSLAENAVKNRDHEQFVRGLGEIARIECLNDERAPYTGWRMWKGMVIYTSGAGSTIPIVHYRDALLGYGGSGPTLGRHILRKCGIPAELISYTEDELEHHEYRIIFSREATRVDSDDSVVVDPYSPPDQTWRLIRKEKYPRDLAIQNRQPL